MFISGKYEDDRCTLYKIIDSGFVTTISMPVAKSVIIDVLKEYQRIGHTNLGQVIAQILLFYETKVYTNNWITKVISVQDKEYPHHFENWDEIAKERDKYLEIYMLLK